MIGFRGMIESVLVGFGSWRCDSRSTTVERVDSVVLVL